MKELFKFSAEFKQQNGLYFGSIIIIYILIAPFMGIETLSISLVWEMLLVSVLITVLQYIFYTWDGLSKVSLKVRVVIHYFVLLLLGAGFVNVFNWFYIKDMKKLLIAWIIYTMCFSAISLSFYLYHAVTGERYNEKLKIYKNSKKEMGDK